MSSRELPFQARRETTTCHKEEISGGVSIYIHKAVTFKALQMTMIWYRQGLDYGSHLRLMVRETTNRRVISGFHLTAQQMHGLLMDPSSFGASCFDTAKSRCSESRSVFHQDMSPRWSRGPGLWRDFGTQLLNNIGCMIKHQHRSVSAAPR